MEEPGGLPSMGSHRVYTTETPGLGRSTGVENGNPLQDSCLGNPMDKEARRCQ